MPNTTTHLFNLRVHELQHQAVRDLAWCCFSAPIMQELPGSDAIILPFSNDQLWPWLIALDQQPDALIEQIANVKSTRLGIYYETLWRFYFSQHSEWELLQHNLQVERKGTTLGAFDFLCRRGSEYWHIETAVKFYLCNTINPDDARNWHHWIGPGSHDRLDLKLAHLRQHQLPLHQTAEATIQLQTLYPEATEWKTGLCLQGYLFSSVSTSYSPAFSKKNHGNGCWWYLQDFLQHLRKHLDIQWIILERQHWLSPAHINDNNKLVQGGDLTQHLQQQIGEMKRPLLLAALKKTDSTDNYWYEDWRGFVVPDNWPQDPPTL
jgi:hypothetical protein